MDTQSVRLVNESGQVLAVARVRDEGGYYGGTVELCMAPIDVRTLFEEFEAVLNDQMFSIVDEVQERINALRMKAVFDGGCEAPIEDLQVFPSTGEVSFKLATIPVGHR